MAVHIENIAVKNLGPISEFSAEFCKFNLIYGRNEMGKTFLTEFLIASLFKDKSSWSLRNLSGQGRVMVSGLGLNSIDFSPEKKTKLEDYWQTDNRELPLNMARLLVVKGGISAINTKQPDGVGRDELAQALSHDRTLDQILGRFKPTELQAKIEDGIITGDKRGPLREKDSLYQQWQNYTDLLNRVHSNYSAGGIKELELQKEKIAADLNLLHKAKCHQAYQLDRELADLNNQRQNLVDDDIQTLHDLITNEKQNCTKIDDIKNELSEMQSVSENHQWLSHCISVWESMSLNDSHQVKLVHAVIAIVLLGVSFAGSLSGSLIFQIQENTLGMILSISIGSLIFILGLFLLINWVVKAQKMSQEPLKLQERIDIQEGFQNRFGSRPDCLVDLKTEFDVVNIKFIQLKSQQQNLNSLEGETKDKQEKIKRKLFALIGEDVSSSKEWSHKLTELKSRQKELDANITDVKLSLERLGIDREHYRDQPSEIPFDRNRELSSKEELEEINQDLSDLKSDLQALKAEVYGVTGDSPDTPWSKLVNNLQEKCRQAAAEYADVVAYILAAIGLSEVLEDLKDHEDNQIKQALGSTEVITALKTISDQYSKLELVDNSVNVIGTYGQYPLSQLSTGAQEQVLLALRMGLVSHITAGEPLFMILDDAFQHTDWLRREKLLHMVKDMVDFGWQIIYFTMDDHIRDIAKNQVGSLLRDEFKMIEL